MRHIYAITVTTCRQEKYHAIHAGDQSNRTQHGLERQQYIMCTTSSLPHTQSSTLPDGILSLYGGQNAAIGTEQRRLCHQHAAADPHFGSIERAPIANKHRECITGGIDRRRPNYACCFCWWFDCHKLRLIRATGQASTRPTKKARPR